MKRFALITSLTVLFLLGVAIAFVAYRNHIILVRGILGIVLMYLLFVFGSYSNIDISIGTMLIDPKKGKYFIAALVGPIISYWATMQIIEMVIFIWKR